MKALDALTSVLCDPDGIVCIAGSPEDRRLAQAALDELRRTLGHTETLLGTAEQQLRDRDAIIYGLREKLKEIEGSADSILRDMCESEPPAPNEPNSVCIHTDDVRIILGKYLAAGAKP
jgi:hypothetical protein